MRILIAYQYLSFHGGIEHVIQEQATLIAADDSEVLILTSEYSHNEPVDLRGTIPIVRLHTYNGTYAKFGIPYSLPYPTRRNARKIWTHVGQADVVNVHGHPYFFSLLINMAARVRKRPVVLTQHNSRIVSPSRVANRLYWIADRTIGRLNLLLAKHVIVPSDATATYVQELYPKCVGKMDKVYYGIDSERFHPRSDKEKIRADLGLPVTATICLSVRRITFKNGIDLLLKAAQIVTDPNVTFVIAGTGPDLDRARAWAEANALANVRFLGSVEDDDLPSLYGAADIFVLPSRKGEGFPMVVLEAFSSGLPVVATRSGGHVEVISSETGVLVDAGDSQALAQGVEELLDMNLNEMAKSCRQVILDSFTWQFNHEKLLDICAEAMIP